MGNEYTTNTVVETSSESESENGNVEINSHGIAMFVSAALFVLFICVVLNNGVFRNWYLSIIRHVRAQHS